MVKQNKKNELRVDYGYVVSIDGEIRMVGTSFKRAVDEIYTQTSLEKNQLNVVDPRRALNDTSVLNIQPFVLKEKDTDSINSEIVLSKVELY